MSRSRRPKLSPDTRPDWRDPNMPVLAHSRSEGGLKEFPPEVIVEISQYRMYSPVPDWRTDPTYNLKRKR